MAVKISTQELLDLRLPEDEEKALLLLDPGDPLPERYKWDKNNCVRRPDGSRVPGFKIKKEGQTALQNLLERFAGKECNKVIQQFVKMALGESKHKVSPGIMMQYQAKIIEMYHGKAYEKKTEDHNINISIESKVSQLTKLIEEDKRKVIDV